MTLTAHPTSMRLSFRHAVRASRGFTLIELMVTLAIAVVLMLVAAPSLIQVRKNSQLSDAVNSFIVGAGTARSAALKTGRNCFIVPNGATGWQTGWFVFVDNNWNSQYDAGIDDVLLMRDAISAEISISTPGSTALSAGALIFNGTGFPKQLSGTPPVPSAPGNGTLTMALPGANGRSSSIVVDTAGRVRSCTTGSPGCSAS